MIRRNIWAVCAAALLAQAVAATESGAPEQGDVAQPGIAPAEWRAMVRGRTVTYQIDGQAWAQEAYDLTTNAVAIRLIDGTCMEGTWSYTDGEYCFAWTSGEHSCFLHVRAADQILIIPVVDGVQSGTIQTVGGISDAPLTCGPARHTQLATGE